MGSVGIFRRVLCGVTGSPGDAEAVSQALALVDPAGTVGLAAFNGGAGAVESGERAAVRAGVRAQVETLPDGDLSRTLLERAERFDLLVLAAPGHSRAVGILLGAIASHAVHSATMPVLISRQVPAIAFPGTVLAATAGPQDAHIVRAAAGIAGAHGRSVILGHAGLPRGAVATALSRQAADVASVCGCTPAVLSGSGDAADRMVALAASAAAGLIVVGSSGRRGVSALASVSERIAHRAACSVLVLRSSPQAHAGVPAFGQSTARVH